MHYCDIDLRDSVLPLDPLDKFVLGKIQMFTMPTTMTVPGVVSFYDIRSVPPTEDTFEILNVP